MTSVASGFYNIRTRSEPHHWLYAKFEETGENDRNKFCLLKCDSPNLLQSRGYFQLIVHSHGEGNQIVSIYSPLYELLLTNEKGMLQFARKKCEMNSRQYKPDKFKLVTTKKTNTTTTEAGESGSDEAPQPPTTFMLQSMVFMSGGQQKFVTDYGYGHLTIAENDGDMNAIELVLVPSRYMFMFSNICSN